MPAWQLNFGIFSLAAVIMLVMAGVSFGYLLRIKNRSRASHFLLWFFLCVILSAIATLLTNLGLAWSWAFAPSQDALIILGGVFLARFAYAFPDQVYFSKARWTFRIFDGFAVLALGYSLYFAYHYLSSLPVQIEEIRAYYLLTPVAILGMVMVFFRRSVIVSMKEIDTLEARQGRWLGFIPVLFKPRNVAATGLRNFGLALSIGLIPVIVFLIKPALPALLANFFFNFGIVLSISATMLVYLNFAPESTTISAKLVGISLVTILLLLGFICILLLHLYPDLGTHRIVAVFIPLVLAGTLFVLLIFPFFLRTILNEPLAKLLEGVHAADEGRLDIVITPSFSDELGFLTESFNRMVNSLTDARDIIQNRALDLEAEVSQRAIDLIHINVRLEKENKKREEAESLLTKQLIYQKSLAGCSQSLLVAAENEKKQQEVLNQALEHLRSGAQASRAYIVNLLEGPGMPPVIRLFAEVCAPGIHAQINNPANQNFPLLRIPVDIVNELAEGKPYGGPVRDVFASTPELREILLTQNSPLLSVVFFPLFYRDRWWGFVGFDDCINERVWDAQEVSMLRTASGMIASTLQRWEIEAQLRKTLDTLEERIQERTAELIQANMVLNDEIQERQNIQKDLEVRLQIEEILANISTRLLEPTGIRDNIMMSLEDLGKIMEAGRVFLAEFDLQSANQLRNYTEWHRPEISPVSEEVVEGFVDSLGGLRDWLRDGKSVYIEDVTKFPSMPDINSSSLQSSPDHALVASPLTIDKRVHAVLGCSRIQSSPNAIKRNLDVLDLVASMLKSLLQREQLVQLLEEQVAERTHQLTAFLDMAMLGDQAQDLSDILQPTLLSIIQIVNCDAAAIHVLNEERASLELVAQRGIPLELLQPLRGIELDNVLADWLEKNNLYKGLGDQKEGFVFPEPFTFPGYREHIADRLHAGGKTLGLLSCFRVESRPFSPFQSTLLTALGELLGIVIENHRLRIEAGELAAVEERQRLAREIHDAVSQSVYSLSLFARSAKDAIGDDNKEMLFSNLQEIENTALQAMREMRLLLYQLREAGQDDNIATALNIRFKQVENRLGIAATCEIEEDIVLSTDIRHEVWRIIIEALNNTVKHARASHVHVRIATLDAHLLVSVQDDGIGFGKIDYSHGMGLKNIQTRTETLGGHLDIVSNPGQGTQIIVEVPMTNLDIG